MGFSCILETENSGCGNLLGSTGWVLLCVCVCVWYRSLLRWWYGRSHKETTGNKQPRQWETDYLLNSEPELRMFYEYHDMGKLQESRAVALFRGTQQKILRKRLKNNKKARIKISEAILSILGDCWEKCICSSLPARLMKRFPASKVHLQPATWLTWKFPSRRRP